MNAENKNIMVFVEQNGGNIADVSLELVCEASRLADRLGGNGHGRGHGPRHAGGPGIPRPVRLP